MRARWQRRARAAVTWVVVLCALVLPVAAAAMSPLLAWRGPVYVAAGLAGVVALCLVFLQPLLAGGKLPGLPSLRGRQIHRRVGGLLVIAVAVHVAGLWITSPPDVIDALTFTSPTPFSDWGVIAMWAVFATGLLAALRRRLRLPPRLWRIAHMILAGVIVVGSVVHAMLIEGTMETTSKVILCVLVVVVFARAVAGLQSRPRRASSR